MKKLTQIVLLLLGSMILTPTIAQVNCELAVGDYPWLSSILDANDCCQNQQVFAYPSGVHTFLYIEKCLGSGPNELYYQDGTFYCSDNVPGGCLNAYGLLEATKTEVWDCARPCGNMEVSGSHTICAGESFLLPQALRDFPTPPQVPQGADGSSPSTICTPQFESAEISPSINVVEQSRGSFLVSPTVTTIYQITSIGRCGGATDVMIPEQTGVLDYFFEVVVEECTDNGGGNMVNAAIFDDYAWLSDIVDPTNCAAESITVYQSGVFEFLYIDNGDGTGSLYLGNGTFYCTGSPTYDCVAAYNLSEVIGTWSCGEGGTTNPLTNGGGDHSDDPIFTDFPWLTSLFDPANCTNDQVAVYDQGAHQFLLVNDALYYQEGTFYCQNAVSFDCVSAYNLEEPVYIWDCQTGGTGSIDPIEEENPPTTPNCENNTGTIVFAPCGEGGDTYVFIQTDDGQLYDLYYASGVTYQATNGQRVKFDFVNAAFDSPCSNATQAIRATCIENIPDPLMNCSMATGTFFFRNCDDGTRFFFIETTDGRILDPYFDAGVSHNPSQGQTVNFDYVDAGNSPCTIAEKAVSITCLEVLDNVLPTGDCNNNRGEIFFAQCDDGTDYFFIRTSSGQIFDPYYAAGVSFQEYDGAQILFDYVAASFSSPCSTAESAVTLTCIEEIVPTEVSNDIPENFETFDVIYRICRGDALRIPNLKREVQCNDGTETQWAAWTGGPFIDSISFITVAPTVTTSYEAEINAFFCGVTGPSYGPAANTSYLVIVDNSTNCDLSAALNQTTFDISGCPNEVVRVPAPNPGTCPLGPPIETNGAIEVLTVAHDYLEIRLLNNGTFTYSTEVDSDLNQVSCPTATYVYQVDVTACEGGEANTRIYDYQACVGDQLTLPIPASTNCSRDRVLENESVVEVLSINPNSMEVKLLKAGHMAVSVTGNELGCANASHLFSFVTRPDCEENGLVNLSTGRGKPFTSTNLVAYPNPTEGVVTLEITNPLLTEQQVFVQDIFGRILQKQTLSNTIARQFLTLDISAYDNGIYYVVLQSKGKRVVQRIVKQ